MPMLDQSADSFLFDPRSKLKLLSGGQGPFQPRQAQNIATPIGPPKPEAQGPTAGSELLKSGQAVSKNLADVDWNDWSWEGIGKSKATKENQGMQKAVDSAPQAPLPQGDQPFLADAMQGKLSFQTKPGETQPAPAGAPPVGSVASIPVPDEYRNVIAQAAEMNGVPVALLTGLLGHESKFNKGARGPVDEIGIAQFRPGTAKMFGIDPNDPTQSIHAAARYLKQGYGQTGNWEGALASYNRGFGGVPTNPGALDYVRRVMALAKTYGAI